MLRSATAANGAATTEQTSLELRSAPDPLNYPHATCSGRVHHTMKAERR